MTATEFIDGIAEQTRRRRSIRSRIKERSRLPWRQSPGTAWPTAYQVNITGIAASSLRAKAGARKGDLDPQPVRSRMRQPKKDHATSRPRSIFNGSGRSAEERHARREDGRRGRILAARTASRSKDPRHTTMTESGSAGAHPSLSFRRVSFALGAVLTGMTLRVRSLSCSATCPCAARRRDRRRASTDVPLARREGEGLQPHVFRSAPTRRPQLLELIDVMGMGGTLSQRQSSRDGNPKSGMRALVSVEEKNKP